jgi:hypothetical protein
VVGGYADFLLRSGEFHFALMNETKQLMNKFILWFCRLIITFNCEAQNWT